ncbi:MAG: hypothetical protein HZB56_19610 [Deltaproteobacteria bacterium]|nr:hypothetical protein [Deltaproteobacteria bacterium]
MSRTRPAPDLGHLAACADDLREALLDRTRGPGEVRGHARLRRRLAAARRRLPRAYRRGVLEPLLRRLDELGPGGLRRLLEDPGEPHLAACLLDLATAVQQARRRPETRALQEVVGDLYDGFLSAEARDGVKAPPGGTLPPLVKWGRPDLGPYTWPVTWTRRLGARAGVVGFPPAAARRGLLLWAALAHETAGHDLLAAEEELRPELGRVAGRALGRRGAGGYWADRIDEAASDVLGILNMGPVAALAMVLHLRAVRAAAGGPARLRGQGPAREHHPAEAARGYLGAAVVRRLRFPGAGAWAAAIEREVDRDVRVLRLGPLRFTRDGAKRMAACLARALLHTRIAALDRRTLAGIQSWSGRDERMVARLRVMLARGGRVSRRLGAGAYAAHAVAAAATAALAGGEPARLQARLVALLVAMNRREPRWRGA